MIELTIIEDCSPYYIRFTHPGIDKIVSKCLEISNKKIYNEGFNHSALDSVDANTILDLVPASAMIELNKTRVSLFVTNPGFYYRAHKDGLDHRFSINYTVKILDDKCVTSWYSDEDLKKYPIDYLKFKEAYRIKNPYLYENGISREAKGFKKENHKPLKSMTALPNEGILFNTDIFHDFDNSRSTNQRIVLTLRAETPADIYFEDAKKLLFSKS